MTANLKNIGFTVLCFAFGLSLFFSIYKSPEAPRQPASTPKKVFQISHMTPEQIKTQLQKKIKVNPTTEGQKTISFSGFSSALCNTYSAIEIEFSAEGISVAGEAPVMKITAPCAASTTDTAEMANIVLPIEKILAEKPRNADFHYEGFTATVAFTNSADEWPKQWVLKRVEFKTTTGAENKTATFNRLPASEESADRPIVLEF